MSTMPSAPTSGQRADNQAPASPDDSAPGAGTHSGTPALLATKLFVPRPPPNWVARPRMEGRLNAGLGRKLTLLAAPAGFGKTTAITAWLATPVGRATPLAWVSLDTGDNDPIRFWSYVCEALATLVPEIAQPVLALLRRPQPLPTEAVLTALLNGLSTLDHDVALVLDDYHVIDTPAIHQALAFFLDYAPPRLHLVITSRADPPLPLARLRAQGELFELRAADLRFTPDEAAEFFAETMALDLAADGVAALTTRTEGWIAGLHLAALSLRDRPDASGFIAAFAGSHRYIVDYLGEEVLGRQPADVHSFLLDTSILDRLSGPLCDAVTGRDDGHVMLEWLERANLFTLPQDDERRWYRYHNLFAEFLRARLAYTAPERLPTLHQRAAAWYEAAGLIPEATSHALAARDVERAARLVEEAVEPMWMRGELTTLLRLLESLPRDTVHARPRLALAHAGAYFLARSYDGDGVGELLVAAEASLAAAQAPTDGDQTSGSGDGQDELRGILAAIRGAVATTTEDASGAISFARQALTLLPADNGFWRIAATLSLGLGHDTGGDTAAAGLALADALRLCHAAEHRYLSVVASMNLARVRATEGRLQAAVDLCQGGLTLAAEHAGGGLPVTGYLHVQLGKIAFERNDFTAATEHLMEGLARVRAVDEQLRVLIEGYAALAWVRHAEGDDAGAAAMLQCCEQAAGASKLAWATPLAAAYCARLALRQGNLAAVVRWAKESWLTPDDDSTYAREFAHLTLARLLIAEVDPTPALRLLDRLRISAEAAARNDSLLEILILQALAHHAAGELSSAVTSLERALTLGEPEGYVRRFLDEGAPLSGLLGTLLAKRSRASRDSLAPPLAAYIARLLAAFGAPYISELDHSVTTVALPEPLTPREREVLALIAAGHSNPEIAARLFISVGTVKTYINRIFAKLAATSRTQAVARARSLGLLPA